MLNAITNLYNLLPQFLLYPHVCMYVCILVLEILYLRTLEHIGTYVLDKNFPRCSCCFYHLGNSVNVNIQLTFYKFLGEQLKWCCGRMRSVCFVTYPIRAVLMSKSKSFQPKELFAWVFKSENLNFSTALLAKRAINDGTVHESISNFSNIQYSPISY